MSAPPTGPQAEAHEINQPLGAVANYAQGAVLRMRNGSVQPAELLPVLEAMAHEALRAGEIIRRIRDLVRKEPSEQKPVDLNALVRDSARVVEGEAPRGHARGSAAPVTRHAEGREGCRWGTTPRVMGRVI